MNAPPRVSFRVLLRPGRADVAAVVRLALPVAVVQVGIMAMGVVDTLMVGRVSPEDLAAVALGNLYFFVVVVFGMGLLMALDPLVAQAVGAGDREGAARALQRGTILATVLGVVAGFALVPAAPLFLLARQPLEVIPIAAGYALWSIPGTLPFYWFVVLRQTLQGMARIAPIVWTIVAANVLNAGLNWMLIWGNLGAPRLGAVGSAMASSLSRWFMAGMLLVVSWQLLRGYLRPVRRGIFRAAPMGRMLRLGAPIGAQFQLEFGAFAAIGIFMGWVGTTTMAAHQVAMNLVAFTFMVPVGIAAAAAVRVGQEVGSGNADGARRSAGAALMLGVGFMVVTAALFLLVPSFFGRLYTDDAGVLAVVVLLLPIAGVFQVFDGVQAVAAGVLRGVGDTRAPMWINILGFWVLGIPFSLFLGFGLGWGAAGLWWGLAGGLAAVCVLLVLRVRHRMGRELRRLVMED
ncbi:MAG: MATE family efflux transporter [Gemmatimonadales bacterium]|nr:MAG: MATE family efflux transporter [Gemmatimonadales bacterium]